jgi:hypothetical protein
MVVSSQLSYISENTLHAGASQVPLGESQHRPKPTAQDLFLRSNPSQFALPDDGRQSHHLRRKRRRLSLYLSGWRSLYMGRERMARDLGWSLATVRRMLRDLRLLRLLTTGKPASEHGNRHRTLHPENLRREDDPSACREDDPQEVRKKNHKKKPDPEKPDTLKRQNQPFRRRVMTELPLIATEPGRPNPKTCWDAALRAFDVLSYPNQVFPEEIAGRICWTLYRAFCAAKNNGHGDVSTVVRYYLAAFRNFDHFNECEQNAFLEESEPRLRKFIRDNCTPKARRQLRRFLADLKDHAYEAAKRGGWPGYCTVADARLAHETWRQAGYRLALDPDGHTWEQLWGDSPDDPVE